MPSPSKSLELCSDFDNTLVSENTGVALIRFYVLHGKGESLVKRIGRVLPLMTAYRRRKYFNHFYQVLRRISPAERKAILARATVNERWIAAVQALRLEHNARDVMVTIISRNSVDVIKEWLLLHEHRFAEQHVRVHTIIANKPLSDTAQEFVRSTHRHIDRAGFGDLQEEGKRAFIGKTTIYLGDQEEELLAPFVKQFVRV